MIIAVIFEILTEEHKKDCMFMEVYLPLLEKMLTKLNFLRRRESVMGGGGVKLTTGKVAKKQLS